MLDPRTKLFLSFLCGGLIVASVHAVWLAGYGAALFLGIGLSGHGAAYLQWLKGLLPMAIFFALVSGFSFDLTTGVAAGFKLMNLATVFFVFFITTKPEDVTNSLIKAGLPQSAAFIVGAALQFVPVLARRAAGVRDAQRARGIPMALGWRGVRTYPAFLWPLLVQAFQMADALAEAMETRGFGLPGRTFLTDYRFGSMDLLAALGGIGMVAGLFLCENRWPGMFFQ
jgi:energy-coupling factor transport system permease protein